MSPADTNSFDDPGLKAAVRRAWGAECAPEGLRARVAGLAASAAAGSGPTETSVPMRLVPAYSAPAPIRGRRRWKEALTAPVARYAMAAAAMVIIGFGLAYRLDQSGPQIRPGVNSTIAALPVSLTQGLVDRHEKCLKYADHHRLAGVPRNDFVMMGQRLHNQLGFRVLAAPLQDAGPATGPTAGPAGAGRADEWEFAGASVCPVDSYDCSHLLYRRKGKNVAVSIISLPRHACAHLSGDWECEYRDPRHPMAGVISGDGVYCVIGSSSDGSLTQAEVQQILNDLRRRTNFLPRPRSIPSR